MSLARKKTQKEISFEDKKAAEKQVLKEQKSIGYDTKDFTIELLVSKFEKNEFYIPDYQRRFIWKQEDKELFLESVLLGYPIPFMFLADCEDGRQEIIDGAQRMQTLVAFNKNKFRLENLKKLDKLNGFYFKDLLESQQRKFLNRTLRIIVLGEDTPDTARQDLFNRINKSGRKANPSELRRGAYPGALTKFIDECSNNELFIKLTPMSKDNVERYERFELVLRFFAYVHNYEKIGQEVSEELTKFLEKNLESFNREEYKKEFLEMLHFVDKYFPFGFAKTKTAKSTPRVRFEAIAVGVALALREKPELSVSNVDWAIPSEKKEKKTKFDILTRSDSSNNPGRLATRVEYVRDQLLKG